MDTPYSLKEAIVCAFDRYIAENLEIPNPSFGNLPACPFVHGERSKGRIRYEICALTPNDTVPVWAVIENFLRDTVCTTMLIVDPFSQLSKEDGVRFGVGLCDRLRPFNFFAACIHPHDTFEVDGFRTRAPAPHMAILVQSLKLLNWGRSILKQTSYFDRWSDANLEYVRSQVGD